MCSVAQLCLILCDPMDYSLSGSCPWDFPGKNTGVGCHFHLHRIFLTQGMNSRLLHWAGRFFTTEPPGQPVDIYIMIYNYHSLKMNKDSMDQ